MLSKFFEPIEIDGYKFDKGSILYEFDAMREPEKTQFPKIGEFIRSRSEMVEIDTPQMYWNGVYWPDLFISNRIDSFLLCNLGDNPRCGWDLENHPRNKHDWSAEIPLVGPSLEYQGGWLHQNFIEPMCRKISGVPSWLISAKYHRSLWLPMYWPETVTEGKSLETKFYYPKAGYAGAPLHDLPETKKETKEQRDYDTAGIQITFVIARPKTRFSVLFVVDHPSIYRITNQTECAGRGESCLHKFVVESNGAIEASDLLQFMDEVEIMGQHTIKMTIPTIRNVSMGWKPAPTMNDQIWSVLHGIT